MAIPTEVTFHEVERSDSVAAAIERWVSRIEHLSDRIVDCHVRVEQPHRHARRGRPFAVHVKLDIPGNEIIGTWENEDIYVAVADAFRAVRRQLLDKAKRRTPHLGSYVSRHATV